MKSSINAIMLVLAAGTLGACATSQNTSLYEGDAHPEEVVVASCDAATATLKGRHDHDIANRACVRAKTRQKVD